MKWGIDQVKIEINDKIKVHYYYLVLKTCLL